jgi:hypothetical protein
MAESLAYREEAASGYDRAFGHVEILFGGGRK